MKIRALAYLEEILQAIGDTALFLKGIGSYAEYAENLIARRAVERELEIVGEAMNQLLLEYPDIAIPESRQIIGMRNRIIHGYARIDNALVYKTAIENVPLLKAHVIALMEKFETS
jgi:uncharacterized protein with HEPN domain